MEPKTTDAVYRASFPSIELREQSDGAAPKLVGHFAVFDQWTEINSMFEGSFLERIMPGSFTKTFAENRDQMRVLFQHGHDPQIGDKPLGSITDLREDKTGAYYEAELFDTSYNADLIPALRKGAYGASFRFRVLREDLNDEPGASAANPKGLPERTIREAKVLEFGPVTFPAYAGASAGVRSLTDVIHDVERVASAAPILLDEERLAAAQAFVARAVLLDDDAVTSDTEDAPSQSSADPADHPAPERRDPSPTRRLARPYWRLGAEPPPAWRLRQ